MHSDIIKSVSRLITERKHTISSALVWSAQQATSDFLLFLSLLPPEVNIGKPNPPPSLHTYEHTNTTCDCFLPAGAASNSWEIGDGSEMCTAVWREFKHGNQCKGGGDTVMCVCVCVWTSERCGSSADNPNLTLSAARWAVFAEIKHIFRATLTAGA